MVDIDFTPYVRPARMTAPNGVVLGIRLIKAGTEDLSPSAKVALRRVRECTVRVQTTMKERDRLRPESTRPLDQKLDGTWGALRNRIEAYVRGDLPEAKLAQSILDKLSLGSLEFLTFDYEVEWVESSKRLERIDEEGLTRNVEKLAGANFLAEVRGAHQALGEALGLGEGHREIASSTALSEAITQLANAIARYGRIRSAECDVEDADSVRRFLAAMAPLDEHRSVNRVTRDDTAAPEEPQPTPTDPVPPVA